MYDHEIIRLYFARDERAIRETADKYGVLCFNTAYYILGNREDAEESLNDMFFAVWNAIPPEKPENLRAYVRKVARNQALKRLEHDSAKKRSPDSLIPFSELEEIISGSPPGDPTSNVTAKELGQLIESFLKKQSADARCVFVRRYWFFEPISVIAKKYSFSESKVKTLLCRTRAKLKIFLEKEGYSI